jgi:hypothetical protein
MEEFRTEIRTMFHDLTQQLVQTIQSAQQPEQTQPDQAEQPHDDLTEEEPQWAAILEDLPAAPVITEASWPKIYKLAKN